MQTEQFSVILISYNQRTTIVAAAESVLTALAGRGEVICVDDGSTDGSASLLDELAARHAAMRVVHLSHSGRPSVARNAGLAIARGTWISFLDGDDLHDPRRFDVLAAALGAQRIAPDVLCHNHRVFMDGSEPSEGRPRITPELEAAVIADAAVSGAEGDGPMLFDGDRFAVFLIARRFLLQTSSICVRRDILTSRQLRFDEQRVFGEDHPFLLACMLGSRVLYLRDSLSWYRKHHRSLTASIDPQGHHEQLRSLHEQVAQVERTAPAALTGQARADMRRMLLEETLHQGYLLESTGQPMRAVRCYLGAASAFRHPRAGLLAAKALVRRPRPLHHQLDSSEPRMK